VARLLERGLAIRSPRDTEGEKSGIVLAALPGSDASAVGRRLAEAGIVLSVRDGALRFSPHAYNTHDELDRAAMEIR
jgi:selenocysteine lyase/cysteine desulfurase